jgi:hypothetical protein
MKIKITTHTRLQGSALLLALLTAFVICIALTTYLYLVSNQNRSVMRSMAWNSSIPVVEAGVEEALTQVNYVGSTNLNSNGWGAMSADGFFHKYNDLGNGFAYDVGVKPPLAFGPDQPTIESIGYAPAPANFASYYSSPWGMILGGLVSQHSPDRVSAKRKVRVLAKRQTPVQYAMLAKGLIDLHGNNASTDSFNSTNSNYSTNGKYDKALSRDHGDVATNAGIVNGLNAGNANIKGHASTGPDGSVAIGSSGSIGDKAWVDGNNKGAQAGHVSDDTNVEIPDVVVPFTTGATPIGGQFPPLIGPTYDYILTNGNYILSSFSGKVLVIGNAQLLVNSSFKFTGQDQITINPGASLDVYVAAASADLGGNGVANIDGSAISFVYYGLKSNTSLKFSGNAAFTGVVYAPFADFTLGGGGNDTADFVGASVSNTATLNGHFNFHYDESLAGRFPIRRYVVYSWNELNPNE